LARKIEEELAKDEILELYLNHIYFGHGRYGVEEAARFYFGKSVKDVTLAEAATLAGLVKSPGTLSPRVDIGKSKERRDQVLSQMAAKGFDGTPAGHHAYAATVIASDDAKNSITVRVGNVTGIVDLSDAARYNPKALPPSQFAEIGKTVRVTMLGRPDEVGVVKAHLD